MGKIDKDLALDMMLSGESDSKIGVHFGTSRQAVNLLRKSFTNDGRLTTAEQTPRQIDNTLFVNESAKEGPVSTMSGGVDKVVTQEQGRNYPTFEQLTDWMINIIKDAVDAARLRQENDVISARIKELELKTKQLQEELEQVNNHLLIVTENTRRYETVIRKLSLPPPGTS